MNDRQIAAKVMEFIDANRTWWDTSTASELSKVMEAVHAVAGEVRYEVLSLVLERVGPWMNARG